MPRRFEEGGIEQQVKILPDIEQMINDDDLSDDAVETTNL